VGTSGRGGSIKKGAIGQIWWMYFVFMYENRTMKLVEIVLTWRRMRENSGGGVRIKIYCKHICKCCNVLPCTTIIC
jgi:hypothetical protein